MNTKTLHSRRCRVIFSPGAGWDVVRAGWVAIRQVAIRQIYMSKLGSLTAAVVFGMIVAIASCADAAEHRVALVVGNSNYKTAELALPNPKNDAEDISAILRDLSFEVITAIDATKPVMEEKLADFARKAKGADTALFFYAGHAMQYQGSNYLMPTNAELKDEYSVKFQMVALDSVQTALDPANGVKIMILDACRDNPLAVSLMQRTFGSSRAVSPTRGLARVDKTQGMLIAYATAPDQTAQDGSGHNSPFTAALLKRLREPGLSIESMFRFVRSDVELQTGGKQHPEYMNQLSSEYFLNQRDRIEWDQIDHDDVNALRDFIDKFPSSQLAVDARDVLLKRYQKDREEFDRREAEAQRAQEAARRRAEDEREAARRAQEQEAARRAQDEREAARRAQEQEAARRAQDEREAARRAQDERQRAEQLAEQQKRLDDDQKRLEEVQKRLADGWRAEQEAAARQKASDQARIKLATAESKQQAEQRGMTDNITGTVASLPPAVSPVPKPPTVELPVSPSLPEVNTPRQIRKAQQELRRLVCFDGRPNGNLDSETKRAVKKYWEKTRQDAGEVKITDEFISELQQQDDPVCSAVRGKEPSATASRPPKPPKQPKVASAPPPLPPSRHSSRPPEAKAPPPSAGPARPPEPKATLYLGVGH